MSIVRKILYGVSKFKSEQFDFYQKNDLETNTAYLLSFQGFSAKQLKNISFLVNPQLKQYLLLPLLISKSIIFLLDIPKYLSVFIIFFNLKMGSGSSKSQITQPRYECFLEGRKREDVQFVKFSKLNQSKSSALRELANYKHNFLIIRFESPNRQESGYGTGFIIYTSPTHYLILTCYHNIVMQNGGSYKCSFGASHQNFQGVNLQGHKFHLEPIYPRPGDEIFGADVGLFKTPRTNQIFLNELTLADINTTYQFQVIVFGFLENSEDSLEGEEKNGRIEEYKDWQFKEIQHFAATDRGFSGAPIFSYSATQKRLEIVGVHTRSDSYSANFGLKLDQKIIGWIEKEKEKIQSPKIIFHQICDLEIDQKKNPDEQVVNSKIVMEAQRNFPNQIKKINLMDLPITDLTVQFIKQNFNSVIVLKLSQTGITNNGLILCLQLPKLQDLSAKNTKVTYHFIDCVKNVTQRLTKNLLYLNLSRDLFESFEDQAKSEAVQLYVYELITLFPKLDSLTIGYTRENGELRLHLNSCIKNSFLKDSPQLLKQINNTELKIDDQDFNMTKMSRYEQQRNQLQWVIEKWQERPEFTRIMQTLAKKKEEVEEKIQAQNYKSLQQLQDFAFRKMISFMLAKKRYEDRMALSGTISTTQKQIIKVKQIQIKTDKEIRDEFEKDIKAAGGIYKRAKFVCSKGSVPCIQ